MSKIILDDITSGYDASTKINSNNAKLSASIDDSVSRSGKQPNGMLAKLDMNDQRIINLKDAVNNQDAVTLNQVLGGVDLLVTQVPLTKTNIAQKLLENTPVEDYLETQYGFSIVDDANRHHASGNIMRYGADPTNTLNSASSFALQVALNVQSWEAEGNEGSQVKIPRGAYRMDENVFGFYKAGTDAQYFNPDADFTRPDIVGYGTGYTSNFANNDPSGGSYLLWEEDKGLRMGESGTQAINNIVLKNFAMWGTPTTQPILHLDTFNRSDIDLQICQYGDGTAVYLAEADGGTKIVLRISGDPSKAQGLKEGRGFWFNNVRTTPLTAGGTIEIKLGCTHLRQPFEFGSIYTTKGDVYDNLSLIFATRFTDTPARMRWGFASYKINSYRSDDVDSGSLWFTDSTGMYDGQGASDIDSPIVVDQVQIMTRTQIDGSAGITLGDTTGNNSRDAFGPIVFNNIGSRYISDKTVLVHKKSNLAINGEVIFNNPTPNGMYTTDVGGAFLAIPTGPQLSPVTINGVEGLARNIASRSLWVIDDTTIAAANPTSAIQFANFKDGTMAGTYAWPATIDYSACSSLPRAMIITPTVTGNQVINLPTGTNIVPFKTTIFVTDIDVLTTVNLNPGASGQINAFAVGGTFTLDVGGSALTLHQLSSGTAAVYYVTQEKVWSTEYRRTQWTTAVVDNPTAITGRYHQHNILNETGLVDLTFGLGTYNGQVLKIKYAALVSGLGDGTAIVRVPTGKIVHNGAAYSTLTFDTVATGEAWVELRWNQHASAGLGVWDLVDDSATATYVKGI